MSTVNITISNKKSLTVSSNDIPRGTIFMGNVGRREERVYIKAHRVIVALENGSTWPECFVDNYVVCNAEINIEPIV